MRSTTSSKRVAAGIDGAGLGAGVTVAGVVESAGGCAAGAAESWANICDTKVNRTRTEAQPKILIRTFRE
jgi:hypothetical protein